MTRHDQHKIPSAPHVGQRVLWRHWMSPRAPAEGWVRELTVDGQLVRIAKSSRPSDSGIWYRSGEIRVEALLEAAAAAVQLRQPRGAKSDEAEEEEEL